MDSEENLIEPCLECPKCLAILGRGLDGTDTHYIVKSTPKMKNDDIIIYCVECKNEIGLSNYFGRKKKCTDCIKQRTLEYRNKTKLWMREYQKGWRDRNRKKIYEYNLEYRLIGERLREQGIRIYP